ncbi:MAG: serine/threonine-protein kinase [Pseudomonadota bacterium]
MNSVVQKEEVTAARPLSDELQPGTKLLQGQYVIETYLNSGGFGITYLARDSLDRIVVIKECFPGSFCRRNETRVRPRSRSHMNEFRSIVRLFVQEARTLSKMQHPSIVGVHQVFEDNDTAYMALDFVEGRDLLDIIEDDEHSFTPEQVKDLLLKTLDAVSFVHQNDLLHRDISPDNILIDRIGSPVLIDFGAAREEAKRTSRALSTMLVVKDGYSPQEFYVAGSVQNESSDLYALGATFYHLIAGEVPPNSQGRLAAVASDDADPYVPLTELAPEGYDMPFLVSIDKALQVLPKDRFNTADEWMDIVSASVERQVVMRTASSDEAIQRKVSQLTAQTNKQIEQAIAAGEPAAKPKNTTKMVRRRSTIRRNSTPIIPPDPYADDDDTPSAPSPSGKPEAQASAKGFSLSSLSFGSDEAPDEPAPPVRPAEAAPGAAAQPSAPQVTDYAQRVAMRPGVRDAVASAVAEQDAAVAAELEDLSELTGEGGTVAPAKGGKLMTLLSVMTFVVVLCAVASQLLAASTVDGTLNEQIEEAAK